MRVPGVPFDQGRHPQGAFTPTAGVLHRTYGGWAGSYSVGKNGRDGVGIGFPFLIGKLENQWVEFYDTSTKTAHAKGANSWALGIEFEGTNEQPLTDWQVRAGSWIIAIVSDHHGIPRTYYDGPRQQVTGWLSHASVPGSTHYDKVTRADWDRMVALWHAGPPPAVPVPADSAAVDFLRAIGAAAAAKPLLRKGSTGAGVRELQDWLNMLCNAGLVADGDFGANTERWVKQYQKDRGLSADGVVGQQTWAHLIIERLAHG